MQQETVQLVLEGPQQGAMRLQATGMSQPLMTTPPMSQHGAATGNASLLGGSSGSSNASSGSHSSTGRAVALTQPKRIMAAVDADAQKFEAFMLKAFA